MKLLPAVIFVIIIFLAGLLFLQGRSVSMRMGFSGASAGQMRKTALFIASIALLALFGILFMFLGKIALLIALLVLAIFFLSYKKSY
ncbi:MAG: hypothetical protein M1461_11815 [Nitrospirae bacterium]|nr:hypothetical protein [Nitrospirota bacterium]